MGVMSLMNKTSMVAVFGCAVMGLAACGGSTAVDVGNLNIDGSAQNASGGAGGSAGATGGSESTGGSDLGTGGSSSDTGGSGGTSAGSGGAMSVDASVGGSGGTGGAPSSDGGETCRGLIATYETALVEAKRCNPAVSAPQCQVTAPSSLPCPGCSVRVNDVAMLTELRKQWTAAGCKGGICPAIACILPGAPRCIPTDGGGGVCGSSGLVQ